MTTIAEILTSPDRGLIPHLDTSLGGTWANWLMRRVGTTQGLRLTSFNADPWGEFSTARQVERSIVLAYAIDVDPTDPLTAQIEGNQFSDDLCREVLRWNQRHPGLLSSKIQRLSGAVDLVANAKISGGNPKAWNAIVAVDFSISYISA